MKDSYGRKINYLRLSVTDLCNFRCEYCMPEKGVTKCCHSDILSIEEFTEITRQAARLGISKVRITGGEPLVRRGVVGLISRIAEIPGIHDIAMTTNASLLAPLAADLKKAGLNRLNISLDTLKADRFARISRRGKLSDTLNGIEAALKAGFTGIKLNTVLIGGFNDDEIRDFADFAALHDFTIRFIELMPIGECAVWDRSHFIKAEKVLESLSGLVPLRMDGVSELYALPGGRGRIGLIRPMGNRFCAFCNRIRVTSDGMLKPCLHSKTEIPLRGLKGDDLFNRLREGIGMKPERHEMLETGISGAARNMNRIGG